MSERVMDTLWIITQALDEYAERAEQAERALAEKELEIARLLDFETVEDARAYVVDQAGDAERDDEKALRIKAIDRLDEVLTERDGLRQERDHAREIADALYEKERGLRKEVDRLTELVKLDAGTIRLREQEADGLREQLASSVRDVKAVLETNHGLRAASESARFKLNTAITRAQALGHTGVVNVLEDILVALGRPASPPEKPLETYGGWKGSD